MSYCPLSKEQIMIFYYCLFVRLHKIGIVLSQFLKYFGILFLVLCYFLLIPLLFLSIILDYRLFKLLLQHIDLLFKRVLIRFIQSSKMFPHGFLILFHSLHPYLQLRIINQIISQVALQECIPVLGCFLGHDVGDLSFGFFVFVVIVSKRINGYLRIDLILVEGEEMGDVFGGYSIGDHALDELDELLLVY